MGCTRAAATLWAAAAFVAGCAGPPGPTNEDVPERSTATATVTRQNLTARDELPGWLGYEDPVPLVAGRDGVVTWMPEAGTVIGPGEVIAEIDGTATRLLIGERPAWRRLAVGEPAGPDVRQLNDNLAAFGYAERSALPDDRFDWRTRRAVSLWQADLGLRPTGAVEVGDVVFLSSAARMATVEARPGTWVGPGQSLATLTGREQVVTVDVDVRRRADLTEGSPVTVLLPDGARVEAVVRSVGRIATAPGEGGGEDSEPESPSGDAMVRIEVDLAEPTEGLALDAAPVMVIIERVLAEDRLTVPVGALVAHAGGGYAVERVAAAGDPELVAVEPGRFADGLVEITGEIAEGDEVVVPA